MAATHPPYRRLFFGVSAIAALNLNLFDGFGDGVGYAIPRGITGIEATVVLALGNCAALAWHAVVFRPEWTRPRPVEPVVAAADAPKFSAG